MFKNFIKRAKLGFKYMMISKEIQQYENIPDWAMSRETKEKVVDILERWSELDIELAEILIAEGDEKGMELFNVNSNLVANTLWNYKQQLAG